MIKSGGAIDMYFIYLYCKIAVKLTKTKKWRIYIHWRIYITCSSGGGPIHARVPIHAHP